MTQYNFVTEFGIHTKLLQLIVCLNEMYSKIWTCKPLSDMFPIKNGLKEGDALLSLLINFALEYPIRKIKANHKLLKFNGTHQVVIYVDDVNLGGSP
jgi:hypothetical protein